MMSMLELHMSGRGCGNCRTPWGMSVLWCKNVPMAIETGEVVVVITPQVDELMALFRGEEPK